MKPQYQHLKLIIETPTQEAWDKVTEFFGIDWTDRQGNKSSWRSFMDETCVRINEGVAFFGSDWAYSKPHYSHYEHLTYPQFCERFLNQDNSLEADTKTQLEAIFEAIDELFAPYNNGKIYPEATVLRNKIEKKLLEVTRNSEPLPFGDDRPINVTVYDRVPVVNEDLIIAE